MKAPLLLSCQIFVIAISLLFTGCVPIYYATNAHNVPLLKEKHEFRLSAGLTATEDAGGPDVQAAYAIGENIGIIVHGAYFNGGTESSSWVGKGRIAEAGAGYFKPIGKWCVAEIYGGAGLAKVTNERQSSPYNSFDLTFSKYFMQPAFGFNSKYFEIAFSPKIAWVRFNEVLILDYEYVADANGNLVFKITKQQQTFFAFEPGVTVRAGWKYAKLQLQLIESFQDIPYSQQLSINLGLSMNLANRYKKVAH